MATANFETIDMIRAWIEADNDPENVETRSRAALLRAVRHGQADILRWLLERGVDVSTRDDRRWTPLTRALEQRQFGIASILLEHHPDVNLPDRQGRTPLHWAAQYGTPEIVSRLLERGADPLRASSQGHLPWMQAVWNKRAAILILLLKAVLHHRLSEHWQTEMLFATIDQRRTSLVRVLLEQGVKVNVTRTRWYTGTYGEETPLMVAASKGLTDIARLLIAPGANVHFHNRLRQSALSEALCSRNEDIVRLLEEHGARPGLLEAVHCNDPLAIRQHLQTTSDVEMPNKESVTLLMVAAQLGHTEVARLLIDAGARVNASDDDGMTALMVAASEGHLSMVELLVERGADIDTACYGWTALTFAGTRGNLGIVQRLQEHGASLNWVSTLRGAVYFRRQPHILRYLLEQGADPNAIFDGRGRTALMYAAHYRDYATVALLLERGARADVTDKHGNTAFMFAAQSGSYRTARLLVEHTPNCDLTMALTKAVSGKNLRLVTYLLDRGADIDGKAQDEKPLVAAVWAGNAMFQLLIERGADVHVSNKNGSTPLMRTPECDAIEIARMLIARGVNVNATTVWGRTALMDAINYGRIEIVRLLLEHGADITMQTVKGETAMSEAIRRNYPDILSLLQAPNSIASHP